jgi:phospholipid/cholesterol/gamma-HCH transport system substrate-binding protein
MSVRARTPTPSLASPDPPPNATARSRNRTLTRLAALALLGLVTVVAVVVLTGGGSYSYSFVFDNAGQLVKGDLVRIGGTPAGTVTGLTLTADGRADVHVSIKHSFGPLRDGTSAGIRAQGLVGVASRYVDVSPAPTFKPALASGATIPGDKTTSIVEIDQLFNTFDASTRKGLARLIKGSATWYQGKEHQANQSARYFAPALYATNQLFSEIDRDSGTLQQFIVQTGDALGALASRGQQLTDLVSNTRATTNALASDNRSLSQALTQLPRALRQGSNAFADLRPALGDLQHLVDVSGPATRHLAPFLARLRPVVSRAVPTFHQLRLAFDRGGAGNDLYDALLDLPPLAALTTKDFPNAEKALSQSTPIFSFARPYVPDLVSWVRNFAAAAAPYDANGHYVRSLPVFDAFNFTPDSNGGQLDPKPPDQRGQSPNLKTGLLRRCPGAGATSVPDGSAPFVDNGPLANPDCDPWERIGGTP